MAIQSYSRLTLLLLGSVALLGLAACWCPIADTSSNNCYVNDFRKRDEWTRNNPAFKWRYRTHSYSFEGSENGSCFCSRKSHPCLSSLYYEIRGPFVCPKQMKCGDTDPAGKKIVDC